MKKLELALSIVSIIENKCPNVFNDPIMFLTQIEEGASPRPYAKISFFDGDISFNVEFFYIYELVVTINMPLHDPPKHGYGFIITIDDLKNYLDGTTGFKFNNHNERILYLNDNYKRIQEVLCLAHRMDVEKTVKDIYSIQLSYAERKSKTDS